jgi:hypothetical protein
MKDMKRNNNQSKFKLLFIWGLVILVGFIFFILPQLPFQMGLLGGFNGSNLTIVAILQTVLVLSLIFFALKKMKIKPRQIGLSKKNFFSEALLGACFSVVWALIQFLWIIPNTGGGERADIIGILEMLDGTWTNILWYLPLGIIGGGMTEEIYNRGFFIGGIGEIFNHSKLATLLAALLAIVFFAAGHLPQNLVEWVDLLIPSVAYTVLYLTTKRLTASMVAHGLWNTLAVFLCFFIYN